MKSETILVILFSLLSVLIGCGIGYLVGKSKWIRNVTKAGRERNKVLRDPKLLKEKIEESAKQLNPEGPFEAKIVDEGKELIYNVEEKDGKQVLTLTKKDYVPPKNNKKVLEKKKTKKGKKVIVSDKK